MGGGEKSFVVAGKRNEIKEFKRARGRMLLYQEQVPSLGCAEICLSRSVYWLRVSDGRWTDLPNVSWIPHTGTGFFMHPRHETQSSNCVVSPRGIKATKNLNNAHITLRNEHGRQCLIGDQISIKILENNPSLRTPSQNRVSAVKKRSRPPSGRKLGVQ